MYLKMLACAVVGGGGGSSYKGGASGTGSHDPDTPPSTALAVTSFLAACVSGPCIGLAGNFREWLCHCVWVCVTHHDVTWLRDDVAALSLRTDTCQGSVAIDS